MANGPRARGEGVWGGGECEEGASAGLCGPLRALEKVVPPLGGHSPGVHELVGGPWMSLQLPPATLAGVLVYLVCKRHPHAWGASG